MDGAATALNDALSREPSGGIVRVESVFSATDTHADGWRRGVRSSRQTRTPAPPPVYVVAGTSAPVIRRLLQQRRECSGLLAPSLCVRARVTEVSASEGRLFRSSRRPHPSTRF